MVATETKSLQELISYILSGGELTVKKKIFPDEENYRVLLYCNGAYTRDLPFENETSTIKLLKKGRYHLQIRKRINDENVMENSDYFDYIDLDADVCCGMRNKRVLMEIEEVSIKDGFKLSKLLSESKLVPDDAILILDFVDAVRNYSSHNSRQIEEYRMEMDMGALEGAKAGDSALFLFKSRVEQILKESVLKYGMGDVILISNLEEDENFNWVMEEVFSIAMQNKGVVCTELIRPHDDLETEIKEKLKEVAVRKYVSSPRILNIDVSIKNGTLCAKCEMNQLDSFWCRFDLIKDKKRIDVVYAPENNRHSWELEEDGVYAIEVHMIYLDMKTHKRSKTVEYFTECFDIEYASFLSNDPGVHEKIPLRGNSHPYLDFVLVSSEEIGLDMRKNMPSNLFFKELPHIGGLENMLVSSTDPGFQNNILFSGILISDDGKILTSEQVTKEFDEIRGRCGSYSFVYANPGRIYVSRDFFNICGVYYYADDKSTVVSNNYHMLLLTLNAMGIQASIDAKKASALLSMPRTQMLSQNISSPMDVKGVYMLPFYYDLELTEKGWRYVENKCYRMLNADEPYHESLYWKLIREGVAEIRAHVSDICNNPNRKVVMDLTGGIDSRMLYGALKPDVDCDLTINSQRGRGEREVEIATTLNSLIHNVPYNTSSDTICEMDYFDADMWMRSSNMGHTYGFRLDAAYAFPEHQITLNGAFGEPMTRPEYGQHCFDVPEVELKPETILESYLSKLWHNVVTDDRASKHIFKQVLKEMVGFPTKSPYKKLDCHFIAFRHALHFGVITENKKRNLIVTPLQSLSLFRAYLMAYDVHRSMKGAFDVLGEMDPRLLSVPYEHEKYNKDYERLKQKLNHDVDFMENFDDKVDTAEWEAAQDIREKNRERIIEGLGERYRDCFATHANPKGLDDVAIMDNLQRLLNLVPELEEKVGRALYHYFRSVPKSDAEKYTMYNKITSLLDQVTIFSQSDE